MSRSGFRTFLLFAALLPTAVSAAEPVGTCFDAAAAAERSWGLPPDLIHAIGRVESGHFDHATGRVSAWPWTVNANGSGSWFASRAKAVDFVRTLQARGVQLIDVGCFQIDLFYHPAAFSSLEQAFDPVANADYAARFLTLLHGRTGSWSAAIAGYHSAQAVEGESYRQKVMSQWGGAGATSASAEGGEPKVDPHVVLMSAVARTIHVFGP